VVDAFDFMSFATDTYFSIYGPSRGTEQGEYLETITERPSRAEADWRPGRTTGDTGFTMTTARSRKPY
jgi:hypothetical protein